MKLILFCYGFGLALLRDWFYPVIIFVMIMTMILFIWAVTCAAEGE